MQIIRILILVLVSAVILSQTAAAEDELCLINNSSHAIKYTFNNLGELANDSRTIELAANAGDQNKCIGAVGTIGCVGLYLAVEYNGTWPDYWTDNMAGIGNQTEGEGQKADFWSPCFRNPIVGTGKFYKSGPLQDAGVPDVDWPQSYFYCDRDTCQYHTGDAGHGLYRIYVVDRP